MTHPRPALIAITGFGCRLPGGVRSGSDFWRLLRAGTDATREARGDIDAVYDPRRGVAGKVYTRRGGYLDEVAGFDAAFFGISPREASSMDPQQGLLLQVASEALEHAGLPADRLAGSATGVFVGVCGPDCAKYTDPADVYSGTGTFSSVVAGRLSYVMDLRGPSISVDTACSSSLVAVHLACQSLRSGECDLALAAGVNVITTPDNTIYFSALNALAPDGRCKTFDAAADGYGRGEGCGVIVLKRLEDALDAGDRVHAIVRGSAVNQDGRSNGLTAPSGLAQEAVIRAALRAGDVRPAAVSYVEAHGTGTPLGDPIEMEALAAALGADRTAPLLVGSVKTNIGHLEGAAGIAGLLKVVLSLVHREIPPHLHFHEPSPNIAWDELPLEVPTTPTRWSARDGEARIAGVSAFGMSGTNAHVLLEEAPPTIARRAVQTGDWAVLPLSGKTPEALAAVARAWAGALSSPVAPVALADVAHTAGARRTHHEHRAAIVARSSAEASGLLLALATGEARPGVATGRARAGAARIAFVYSGQGSQWAGMGRRLFDDPVFAEALAECDGAIRRHTSWSVTEELAREPSASRVDETEVAQPTLFAIQVALTRLLSSWGICPEAVVGHSAGEIAAACVAGVLSLEDAARVAVVRGRAMQGATGGRMLAAELEPAAAERLAAEAGAGRVGLAAVNGPRAVVFSGDGDAIESLRKGLEASAIWSRVLPVNYAFHSPQMDGPARQVVLGLEGLRVHPPTLRVISSVTGALATGEDYGPAYWGENVRRVVRFADAMGTLARMRPATFLEVAPHPVLSRSIEECLARTRTDTSVVGTLSRDGDDAFGIRVAVGALHANGCHVAWEAMSPGALVDLPTYPFQEQPILGQSLTTARRPGRARVVQSEGAPRQAHPLLAEYMQPLGTPGVHIWQSDLDASGDDPEDAAHHVLHGVAVAGSGYAVALMLAGAAEAYPGRAGSLEDITLERPLVLHQPRTIQLVLTEDGVDRERVAMRVYSRGQGTGPQGSAAEVHVSGRLRPGAARAEPPVCDLNAVRARCTETLSRASFQQRLRDMGLELGSGLQALGDLWHGETDAVARLNTDDVSRGRARRHGVHPASLDATVMLATVLLPSEQGRTYLPVGIRAVSTWGDPSLATWAIVHLGELGPGRVVVDCTWVDDAGAVLLFAEGLTLRSTAAHVLSELLGANTPAKTSDVLTRMRQGPGSRRAHVMLEYLTQTVAGLLKMPAAEVRAAVPLANLGFDSLMMLALRNRLEKDLHLELTAATAYGYPTLARLGAHLTERLTGELPIVEPAGAPSPELAQERADLSPEDVGDLLEQALLEIEGAP